MVLREHLRSVRKRKEKFEGPKEYIKYYCLRIFVILVFVFSHFYDYATYPIYWIIYHPWLIRRYQQGHHAKVETKKDCIIYQSKEEITQIHKEINENGLTTMDAIFDYAVKKHKDKECLGTRELLSEEDEVQPNGKVFKKWVMGEYRWKTYLQVDEISTNFGRGLRELGLEPKSNVCIFADTKAEW